MKTCPKCQREYIDEYEFCNICGERLISVKKLNFNQKFPLKQKSSILVISVIFIITILGIVISVYENKKMNDTRGEIEEYKYQKAIEEYKTTPNTSDLRINDDWTHEKSGNYIYIKGSVTNTSSSKTINYFEVEAKFYNSSGDVIDSDWTNDGTELEPGETRQFEIMHEYNSEETNIRLSIKDVS